MEWIIVAGFRRCRIRLLYFATDSDRKEIPIPVRIIKGTGKPASPKEHITVLQSNHR